MRGLFGNQKSGKQEGKSTRAGHTLQPFCGCFRFERKAHRRAAALQGFPDFLISN
jgi:hypothetical protein